MALTICQLRKILSKFNFTIKAATRRYVEAEDKKIVRRWQRDTKKYSSRMKKRGFTILIQDESIFVYDSKSNKKYWSEKGEPIHIKMTGSHSKTVVYGAITNKKAQMFHMYEKGNSVTFLKYLKSLHQKWGKILIILDNAKYHVSKNIQEYLDAQKGKVVLHYLPKGWPQLSAIEECWRFTKYDTVYSEYYETEDDMWDAILKYLQYKRFNLDIYKFLEHVI